ncbi:hypothetical protein FBQ81_14165 [Chloroflexi bacterium CFX6]|nr:hypothetical protein [Chloroflexi bacterium CFX6]
MCFSSHVFSRGSIVSRFNKEQRPGVATGALCPWVTCYFFATLRGARLGLAGGSWGAGVSSGVAAGSSEAGAGSGSGNEAGAGGVAGSGGASASLSVPFRRAK